ncbi:Fic family protein [Candidatus Pacearchaeota archaeon]|nr:Fic family protein [Candidatus Pacearchaeota archaeon]
MKISKEDLIRINGGFGGSLRSDSSIEFALQQQKNRKLGPYRKLAYLWRAILVNRPFSDGNKRTAVFLAFAFTDEYNKKIDRDLIVHHALSIAKKNITNIRQIEWRLKNAIK